MNCYSLCRKGNWIKAIKQCYKYNLLDINLDLLGLE
ncbi:tRNA nucleotidyltransferase, partial [Clostridium sporogenes]|nr:tRNA nucleotidyltransferase [Clostridium sporogenes]